MYFKTLFACKILGVSLLFLRPTEKGLPTPTARPTPLPRETVTKTNRTPTWKHAYKNSEPEANASREQQAMPKNQCGHEISTSNGNHDRRTQIITTQPTKKNKQLYGA